MAIGAARDNDNKSYYFKIVKKVEQEILDDVKSNKDYLEFAGKEEFV